MKIAILLHGNMRTFLMPMRGQRRRLCDAFFENVVLPNNADVFAYTDTSNFFHDGTQFYPSDRKIEILNNDSFRLYDKISFIEEERARSLIEREVNEVIGPRLRALVVECPYDASSDCKFETLNNADVKGSSPSLLIHQWRKLKLAYGLMSEYERANGKYDVIVKWRFDLNVTTPLIIGNRDYQKTDVFVAGINDPIIYDWHAFGTRPHMEIYTNLYDRLGFMLAEGKVFMTECRQCRQRIGYGPRMDFCPRCRTTNDLGNYEITLAPEYHLFKLFKIHGTRICNSGYPASPYHYKETSHNGQSMPDIVRSLGLSNVTIVTHTAGKEIGIQKFD